MAEEAQTIFDWTPKADSLGQILLTDWAPGLTALILGGLLANTLYPRWQTRIQRNRDLADRRRALCETVAAAFQSYIANLRRLYDFTPGPDKDANRERQQVYVVKRDDARDALYTAFAHARLYFSPKALRRIDAFIDFNQSYDPPEIEGRRDLTQLKEQEKDIVETLRSELLL